MAKIVDAVTDVPLSIPSNVDILVDLPAKKFSANPRIVAGVVVGVAVVGAVVLVRSKFEIKIGRKQKTVETSETVEEVFSAPLGETPFVPGAFKKSKSAE